MYWYWIKITAIGHAPLTRAATVYRGPAHMTLIFSLVSEYSNTLRKSTYGSLKIASDNCANKFINIHIVVIVMINLFDVPQKYYDLQ